MMSYLCLIETATIIREPLEISYDLDFVKESGDMLRLWDGVEWDI
jgi:hypothetical protein